jgi:hypothetical protein
MSLKELESKLETASDKLGAIMAKMGPDQKKVLRILKQEAEEFANKVLSEKKHYVDKAALFVVAITMDDNLKAEKDLIEAANIYLDADKEYSDGLMSEFQSKIK